MEDGNGLDRVKFQIQWVSHDGSADTDIANATDYTYTLVTADAGKTIKARVAFTDRGGYSETRTSVATGAVTAAPGNPATGAPTISGTAEVGQMLTADTSTIADSDGLTNVVYQYQWLSDDGSSVTEIGGATGSTYTLQADDVGATIKVQVSFSDDADNPESLTSAATAAVSARPNSSPRGGPIIRGTTRLGETLRADTSGISDADGLDNVSYTYQWFRRDWLSLGGAGDTEISGATNNTYTLDSADVGKHIQVRVDFIDDAGNAWRLWSSRTPLIAEGPNTPATGVPTITGIMVAGELVTADTSEITDPDGLTNVSFSYEWIRSDGTNDEVELGDVYKVYRLLDRDQGHRMKVRVSFTDDAGNSESSMTSPETAVVTARALPSSGPFSLKSARTLDLPAANLHPAALWSDGATLWVLDRNDDKIYAYNLATRQSQADRDITLTNGDPNGLYSDGVTMWVLDSQTSKIHAYDLVTGENRQDKEISLDSLNSDPKATWSNDATIWVADGRDDKLYAYDLTTGERRPDQETIEGMKGVGNWWFNDMWSDGVTMWILDGIYDRIYAYDLASGARQPELEFPKLYGNSGGSSSPSGIWSDGATMWVADNYQFKIFAYRMPKNPSLKSLQLQGVEVDFSPSRFNYETWVTRTTATTTVSTTAVWPSSTVEISPEDADSNTAGHQVDLSPGENAITIVVANGDDTGTYSVAIRRTSFDRLSNDASLESLSLGGVNLGTFDSETLQYTIGVASGVTETTVSVTPADEHARVVIDPEDADDVSEGHQIVLAEGSNTISVSVESSDGSAELSYVVTINRSSDAASGWNALKDIELSGAHPLLTGFDFRPSGIWSDGTTIWVGHGPEWVPPNLVDPRLYAFNLASGARQSSKDVAIPGRTRVRGLWSDRTTIWVADWAEGKLLGIDLTTGDHDSNIDIDTASVSDNYHPWGIWSNGETIWVVEGRGGRILAHDLATGSRQPDRDLDIDAAHGRSTRTSGVWTKGEIIGNASPTGIWSDGITIWVADSWDAKIYAYNLASGSRHPELDFDTLADAGNLWPQGIWSDGKTMWVVDDEADKVFAYHMPNNPANGSPTIDGTPQVGSSLIASISDADGLTNSQVSYQWLADDVDIAGATASTYSLVAADEGKTIKVSVTFTDDAGNETTLTSAATDAVEAAAQLDSPATGQPTITGTAQVGETLTADISGIADADGLTNVSYGYQWVANDGTTDADIAGATASTYPLVAADEGKTVKVRVTVTDDLGNETTLTSAATNAVEAAPEPPATPTGLSATVVSHDAVTLAWDDPEDDSITGYVILRRDRAIHPNGTFVTIAGDTGSTDTTYTDDTVEPDKEYVYRIKAINEHGKVSEMSYWLRTDTPAIPVPDAPTGLSTAVSHDAVTLTWDDPEDDSITGYVILRRDRAIHPNGTFVTIAGDTGSTDTTYTDDTVEPDTQYVYRIKAINEHGEVSERSHWVRGFTPN